MNAADALDDRALLPHILKLGSPHNSAYMTARKRCPLVIASESPPRIFLEDDLDAASRRICVYWTFRTQQIWDKGNGFRPLSQLLTAHEIRLVESGFMAFVTPGILLANRARRPLGDEDTIRARVLFAVLTWASLQQREWNIWSIVQSHTSMNVPNQSLFRDLLLYAMPIRITGLQVYVGSTSPQERAFVANLLGPSAHKAVGGKDVVETYSIHESVDTMLGGRPMQVNKIPAEMGGSWHYEFHWKQQVDERLREPNGSLQTNRRPSVTGSFVGSAPSKSKSTAKRRSSKMDTYEKLQEYVSANPSTCFEREDEKKFIRQRNALYAKRKYYKYKLHRESLESRRNHLQEQQSKLRGENQRLQMLLQQARSMEAQITGVPVAPPVSSGAASLESDDSKLVRDIAMLLHRQRHMGSGN